MTKQKIIKAPVETFSGLVAGVHFVDGVGKTDDEAAIAYFERQGYGVGDEPAEQPGNPDATYPAGDPSDKWTKAELLAYAADRKIDLGDAKSKDEVWGAIKPGGTPYKGVTTPEGKALVNDSIDPKDQTVKDQADLPVK
ncbi:hypothetical protein M4D51_07990 [Microbacterium sp. p3-SID338]|uniref:hypothetical protein n=1 Tax=Microbacterium sp. p3-SID338 TaxID=2916214 RepID=UPI0021A6DEE3|nr:hypothetical protein [Microbacterium sp. p3-SID338]MCT1395666.1 hypothetical protein [Microbacterium sp. p3-SID338]